MSEDWVPFNKRERLSFPLLLGIAANQLASNMIWTPIGLLINPMCTLMQLNNVVTTLIILIGPLVGVIVPPIAAAMSDRCMMQWGRRRIFLVVGEVLAFIGLMLLAFCDKMGAHGSQVAGLVMGQTIVSIGGNIFNGPGRSMCTDLAPESQQVTISNLCQVYSGIGGVLSNLIGAVKLYEVVGMQNAQFVLLVSCIVGFFSLVISIVVSKEEPLTTPPPEGKNSFVLVFESFRLFDFPLWLVAIGFFFFQLGANQYNTQIGNFMGMNVFGGDPNAKEGTHELKLYNDGVSHAQTLALIQTIVQVIFSFASTYVTKVLGLKGTWMFGMIAGCVAQFLFFFILNRWVYLICAVLWAFDQVVGNSVPYSVVSLYAPKDNMAGCLTVVVFVGNVAGLLSNFIFTMGLGSVEWFKTNPGRLIALPIVFTFLAALIGACGIMITETRRSEYLDNEEGSEDAGEKEEIDDSNIVA